jgi:hypothetical protein
MVSLRTRSTRRYVRCGTGATSRSRRRDPLGVHRAPLVVVTSMLGRPVEAGSAGAASAVPEPTRHRLSCTAAGSGPADLAERADDYLGAGAFGHPGS